MIGSDPIDQIWNELKRNCALPSLHKVITKKKHATTCKVERKSRKKKNILQSILCNDSATSNGNTPGDVISASYTYTWNEKILLNINGSTSLEVDDSDDDDEEESPSVIVKWTTLNRFTMIAILYCVANIISIDFTMSLIYF